MAQINANVNKKLGLTSSSSLFLVSANTLVENKQTIKEVAEKGKDEDGILYIFYAQQDPFGSLGLEYKKCEYIQGGLNLKLNPSKKKDCMNIWETY